MVQKMTQCCVVSAVAVAIGLCPPGSASDFALELPYSTLFGGSFSDYATALALDSSGDIYVAGYTESLDLPTVNPLQAAFAGGNNDAVVSKLWQPPDITVLGMTKDAGQYRIEWTGGPAKTQYVARSSSLVAPIWTHVATSAPPHAPTNFYVSGETEPNAAFFRIQNQ